MLDARLLNPDTQQTVHSRFCRHIPPHPWNNRDDVPWAFTVGEDFANAYAYIFHGERTPGAGHWLSPADVDWLKGFLLALDPSDRIWI